MYTTEQLQVIINAVRDAGSQRKAAKALGTSRHYVDNGMKLAAERGMLGFEPVLPGFRVASVSNGPNGTHITQKPERGKTFKVPDGHVVKGFSTLVDGEGRTVQQWIKTREEDVAAASWREALDEFKRDLPRVPAVAGPTHVNSDLCVQYTVTDHHIGMLADAEETGDADYDLQIAEQLLTDWFSAAVAMSPSSGTAVFAQLGDLLHYDSMRSETPEHRNMLDSDTRPQKMIRVAIRVVRRIIGMLLDKHDHVHVIMAKANHDPYSSAWLRESLAVLYEDEPRLTVDTSASEYYAYPFGKTLLAYHHGHKRGVKDLDRVIAGMFRKEYGTARHVYAHCGHLHNDAVEETSLMKIERHRTLAARDAYAASGGWLSGRDAKVIVYHKEFGEVSRLTLSPEMVSRGSTL